METDLELIQRRRTK